MLDLLKTYRDRGTWRASCPESRRSLTRPYGRPFPSGRRSPSSAPAPPPDTSRSARATSRCRSYGSAGRSRSRPRRYWSCSACGPASAPAAPTTSRSRPRSPNPVRQGRDRRLSPQVRTPSLGQQPSSSPSRAAAPRPAGSRSNIDGASNAPRQAERPGADTRPLHDPRRPESTARLRRGRPWRLASPAAAARPAPRADRAGAVRPRPLPLLRRRGGAGRVVSERTPPSNIKAEEALLGAILLAKRLPVEIAAKVEEADFWRPAHRTVWQAINALADAGDLITPVTLLGRLQAAGELEDIGGASFIHDLFAAAGTTADAERYAEIVAEASKVRRLIDAGTRIVQLGYKSRDA